MDKRTLIGLIVIGAILFGFTWYNSSIQEKLAQEPQTTTQQAASEAVEVPAADASATVVDSASGSAAAQLEQHIGVSLFKATEGTEKHYEIENDLMKVTFSNKGGRVASVVLKDYKTYNGSPLVLFPDSAAVFDLSFFVKQQFNNIQINTGDYYFVADSTADLAFGANETEKSFTMRLDVDSAAHVDFVYKIYKDNYMIDFDVRFVGMERLLAQNQSDLEIIWQNVGMQNEKGFDNENNYTTIAYKYPGDESIEQLGMSKEAKSETINSKLKWVAFKQQFFSSILVSQNDFQNGTVEYTTFQPGEGKIKTFKAKLSVPFSPQLTEYNFNFYFGPNKFSVLKKYGDLHFERLIPLGGWIVGWINRWLVIPTFDTLGKHIANYGIIILLLTIILKILISPLTYKSYLSTAKMRLLKPEVDKLNEKYPNQADAMKKQQAMMALYKSAGVNPMGGCIPLLIQFPILIAMFRFFPASIELREQPFLWADDLSSVQHPVLRQPRQPVRAADGRIRVRLIADQLRTDSRFGPANGRDEVHDALPDADHAVALVQQLLERTELLLPAQQYHYDRADLRFPLHRERGQVAPADEGECQETTEKIQMAAALRRDGKAATAAGRRKS